jgi:hypothetical protein
MRAIVIDPAAVTVEEVDTDASPKSLQQIIGGPIDSEDMGADHHCYFSKENTSRDKTKHSFQFRGMKILKSFPGRGVLLASCPDGSPAPCTLTVKWVNANTSFIHMGPVVWFAGAAPSGHAPRPADMSDPISKPSSHRAEADDHSDTGQQYMRAILIDPAAKTV